MTWNYRLVEYADDGGFGIHEVYYDGDQATGMTESSISFYSEDRDGLIWALETALKDAKERPIFRIPSPDQWPTGIDGVEA